MSHTSDSTYFFSNTHCAYFPCHPGAEAGSFNCMFCYCPLYMLGPECGGAYRYTHRGIKDCSGCLLPHRADAYLRIREKFPQILAAMEQLHGDSPHNIPRP